MEEAWEFAALMPTVLRWKGHKFFFYSDEEDRAHIHVKKERSQAKFWLNDVELAHSKGFSQKELNRLKKIVQTERETLLGAWNDYFDTHH